MEKQVLGWTRDKKGAIVDRHPVDVANSVTAAKRDNTQNYVVEPTAVAMRGREPQAMAPKRTEYGKKVRKDYEAHKIAEQRKYMQQLEPRTDGVTNTLTGVQKDNLVAEPVVLNATSDGLATTLTGAHHYSGNIVNPKRGQKEMGIMEGLRIRKLTPRECFRLMGVRDEDIDKIQAAGISKSQQYKMAGNSIVVNCLAAIFKNLFEL